jgi:sodium-dependent dicarboxylate transporter 2/3/5
MVTTFALSMFISNTATTAMMVAVMAPLVANLEEGDPFAKALLLGVPFAANLGGMASLIGSPPNAIAVGLLAPIRPIPFVEWMLLGAPPAIFLVIVVWCLLLRRYPARGDTVDLTALDADGETPHPRPWERFVVLAVFAVTVGLWLTGPLHGIPTPVVSFIPTTVLAVSGVIGPEEIRRLHWDILLLLAGGLALGVAVRDTGLAVWLVDCLPVEGLSIPLLALAFALACSVLSNLMSNTATANILVPLALAAGGAAAPRLVVPVALAASSAMCLPISTPPNAIAYAQGRLESRDFLVGGLVVAGLGIPLFVVWCGVWL